LQSRKAPRRRNLDSNEQSKATLDLRKLFV
jgi:hypothetical protein